MDEIPVGAVLLREVSYVCVCPRRNTLTGNSEHQQEAAFRARMEPEVSFDANWPVENLSKARRPADRKHHRATQGPTVHPTTRPEGFPWWWQLRISDPVRTVV